MKKLKIMGYTITAVAFACFVFAIILLLTGVSGRASIKDNGSFSVIIFALLHISYMVMLIGTVFFSGIFVFIVAKTGNKNAVLKLVFGIIFSIITMFAALGCFAVSVFTQIAPRNIQDVLTLSCYIMAFAVGFAELVFSIINYVFKRKNAAIAITPENVTTENTITENVQITADAKNPYRQNNYDKR